MKRLWLLIGALIVGALAGKTTFADNLSTVNAPAVSVFSSSDGNQTTVGDDSSQATRAAQRRLYLPSKTPVPLEGYRWPTTRLKIYMATQSKPLMTAFRDAVRQWNKVGAVRLSWTKDRERADIVAEDGDLSSGQTNPGVGYVTTQLGSTRAEYNPDTHAMIQARSTLDRLHLEYASREFRSEVAQHELGHALGLAHAPQGTHSVMVATNVHTGITAADRKTVWMLYGEK